MLNFTFTQYESNTNDYELNMYEYELNMNNLFRDLTFCGRQAKSLAAAPWLGRRGRTYYNHI